MSFTDKTWKYTKKKAETFSSSIYQPNEKGGWDLMLPGNPILY